MHRGNRTFALALFVVFLGCTDTKEQQQGNPTQATDPGTMVTTGSNAVGNPDRIVISRTSWGVIPDKKKKTPEEPPIPVSWEEGQRQKFHREGMKRWKNTEIYVRRSR